MTNLVTPRDRARRRALGRRVSRRHRAPRASRRVAAARVVCFVGITGYRVAVDRTRQLGWQPEPFGGRTDLRDAEHERPRTRTRNRPTSPSISTRCTSRRPGYLSSVGLLLERGERVVERLRERRRRLRAPGRGDVVEVDARACEAARSRRARRRRPSSTASATQVGVALAQHVDRRLRERVHGVLADEVVDVERGGVRRVLRRRRRPQRPLLARARRSSFSHRGPRAARGTSGTPAWRLRPRPCPRSGDLRAADGRSRCRPGSRRTTRPTRAGSRRRRWPRAAPGPRGTLRSPAS